MIEKNDKFKAWVIVFVAALITAIMVYGNFIAKRGGIVDNAILDKNDLYYQMDQKVKGFFSKGLKSGEAISFVIPFSQPVSWQDLEYVKFFTNDLKEEFPEYGVLSLSATPHYRDTGSELLNAPYVDDELIETIKSDPPVSMKNWLEVIKEDPAAYGLLIGRKFNYAQVIMLLPPMYDEIQVFRRVVQFLEQRAIPEWEWNFKKNIYPSKQYGRVLPAGWVMARGLMDAALTSDVLKLSSIGLLSVAVAFFLSLASLRQSVIASMVIILCFIWVRGAPGIFQALGYDLHERVYFLFVYTAIIVSGISFAERKFEAFNEVRSQSPHDNRYKIWKKTGYVNEMIIVTALISFLNFITLYQIGVRGILEVGIFSALGIVSLVFLTLYFVPAFHSLTGGEVSGGHRAFVARMSERWNGFLSAIVHRCYQILTVRDANKISFGKKAWIALLITVAMMVTAIATIFLGHIDVRTRPMEYLPDTIVDRACNLLDKPGNAGFDRIPILLMPKKESGDGHGVRDPGFLRNVDKFRERVLSFDTVREANSVVDTLKVISRESFKSYMPVNERQINDGLNMIAWDLGNAIKEQLWFDSGVAIFISKSGQDSNLITKLCDNIISLAEKEFPDMDVTIFGKAAFYQRIDKYIREGKPWNAVTSQWIVIVIGALWIIWRNRSRKNLVRLMGWRTGLVLNIPFLFASSITVLLMAFLRIPLDQATACTTALAINASVDFGIYLVADYQTALRNGHDLDGALYYALADRGRIITVDIVLNAICFAPLMLSSFLPVARLGWLVIVMLIACGVGALLIMPALLPWCVRGRGQTP
jgi:predicted RND superfamily exporter protein